MKNLLRSFLAATICVAVINGREMVVASTTVDADALGELVARHTSKDAKGHLRLAKFRF